MRTSQVPTTLLGNLTVSRFMVGGNPFAGFSHLSRERSQQMLAWYTDARIVDVLFQAQELGLRACLSRGDDHVAAVLRRYWDEGGNMAWIAQTDSRSETSVTGAQYCIDHGASAVYLHGGIMDHYIAQRRHDDIQAFVETVRAAKLPVGVAAHMPDCLLWAEEHLDLDFYMGCYYNPSPRDRVPHHDPATQENYLERDRDERVAVIKTLSKPVIHYKVLAAGRTDPVAGLTFAARQMRPEDAVCVGIYSGDNPNMLKEDLEILIAALNH